MNPPASASVDTSHHTPGGHTPADAWAALLSSVEEVSGHRREGWEFTVSQHTLLLSSVTFSRTLDCMDFHDFSNAAATQASAPEPEISAFADPAGEAPWAMQLVLRLEKTDPPSRRALLEASALAVVSLLSHPEAVSPDGEWFAAVERWTQGRIRKLARRARASRWHAVQALPGVTVAHRGAEVRAFLPGPTDAVDPLISRLQLSGAEPENADTLSVVPDSRASSGVPQVSVLISTEPALGLGKAAAAAGHAAQLALLGMDSDLSYRWSRAGFPLQVIEPDPDVFAAAAVSAPVVVRDAGFTEVDPGTVTSLALW